MLLVNSGRLVFDGPVEELKEDGSLEQPFYRLTGGGAPPASDNGSGPDSEAQGTAADAGETGVVEPQAGSSSEA